MSSGQKAVAEAEDAWDSLQKEAGIIGVFDNDPYGAAAQHAQKGARHFHYRSNLLVTYVRCQLKIDKLKSDIAQVERDFVKYAEMHADLNNEIVKLPR